MCSSTTAKRDPVLATVASVFERFEKVVRSGCLRPSATFLLFFMHELAKAAPTPHSAAFAHWRQLVDAVPPTLVTALARLDTAALPLSLYVTLYDVSERRYRRQCLRYACMMRKFAQL